MTFLYVQIEQCITSDVSRISLIVVHVMIVPPHTMFQRLPTEYNQRGITYFTHSSSRNDRATIHDLYTSSKRLPTEYNQRGFTYFTHSNSRNDRAVYHDLYTNSRCAFRGSCPSSVKRRYFCSLKPYLATWWVGRLPASFLNVSPPLI